MTFLTILLIYIPCKLTICVFSVIILRNSFVVYSAFNPSHLNKGKKLKRETKYSQLTLFKTDSQTVGTVTRCPSLREALLSIVMENTKKMTGATSGAHSRKLSFFLSCS